MGDGEFYAPGPRSPIGEAPLRAMAFAERLRQHRTICKTLEDYLIVREPRLGRFYLPPKAHKPNPSLPFGMPGRPVRSQVNHSTSKLSDWVNELRQPFMRQTYIAEYLRDTTQFLQEFEGVRQGLPQSATAFSLDTKAMYTNIPNEKAIRACGLMWREHMSSHPVTPRDIEEAVRTIRENSTFEFNGATYKQIKGIATGSSASVAIANIFAAAFFRAALPAAEAAGYRAPFLRRCIRDIFGLWNDAPDGPTLQQFVDWVDQFSAQGGWGIEFELAACGRNGVPSLDVEVYAQADGVFQTRLYCKPTDTHAYLLPSSCHPPQVHYGIPYGVALRIRRICPNPDDLRATLAEFAGHLIARGYDEGYTRSQFARVHTSPARRP